MYSSQNPSGEQSSSDQLIWEPENWIGKWHRNNYSHSRVGWIRNDPREVPIQGRPNGSWPRNERCKQPLLFMVNIQCMVLFISEENCFVSPKKAVWKEFRSLWSNLSNFTQRLLNNFTFLYWFWHIKSKIEHKVIQNNCLNNTSLFFG